jgi:hypothetical protein
MTALPDAESIKTDDEAQAALAAAGSFDAACFPPEMMQAAWAVAREWRRILDSERA